ncbi:MAG: hypothetical protein JNK81_10700 [Anaerolineales bacterium]|nr:hypothetical protein [Anaerolineales bacterium]
MASRKSNVKKISIKKLPKFELDVYSQLSLSDLVVFALSYLEEKEVDATTEEIISICFRLFPNRFGLKNYPRWPDSALVIRRLNDAREKKLVKGNPNDGFALTFKGKQVAKRISKALGIVEKKKKAKSKSKPKPVALVLTKKTLRRRVRKSIQTKTVKKKVAKQKPKKKKVVIQKPAQKVVIKKKAVTKSKPKQVVKKKVFVKKKAQPKQLTLPLSKVQVKKKTDGKKQVEVKKEAVLSKPKQVEVTKNVAAPISISKEEKVKASKVIKIVERSDAYRSYTKNGKQAKISEFDFRNMLFATMESSSDTLTRNVNLFKRYANIHNRNDLIKFFDFCEEHFAKLLKKR